MLRSTTLLVMGLLTTGICWAGDPVVRVASVDPAQKGGKAVLQQQHPGQAPSTAYVKSMGYVQDRYITDGNTVAALEFLIGGRVAMTKNTNIEIKDERSVTGSGESVKRIVLKSGNLWIKADAKQLKQPLEIQTNGGVMGIKGTEFTVETAPDGSTAEVACFESNSEQGGVAIYAPGKEEPLANVKPGEDFKLKIANAQFVDVSKRTATSPEALREEKKNGVFNQLGPQIFSAILSQAGISTFGGALNYNDIQRDPAQALGNMALNMAKSYDPTGLSGMIPGLGGGNRDNKPPKPDFPSELSPDSSPDSKSDKNPAASSLTFNWKGVDDARSYVVLIGTDDAMKDVVFTDEVRAPDMAQKQVSLTYPKSAKPLQKGTRYYWRVVPVDENEEPVKKGSQTYFVLAK